MDDLELVIDADETIVPPSQEEETPPQEEEDLTLEQIAEEAEKLKAEAKEKEDPKEKRYLEQQAGRLQQLAKAKERANLAEQTASEREQRLERIEIESIYEKAIKPELGVDYFEGVWKENPQLAEKVAQEKWGKSAKAIINEVKRQSADEGDEARKQELTMEEMEAKAEHKVAIRTAQKVFDDLNGEEKDLAKKYFDKIAGKGLLNIDEALEIADMAKHYASRNRKVDPKEKEKILANTANTAIGSGKSTAPSQSSEEYTQMLIRSGVDPSVAHAMANVKL